MATPTIQAPARDATSIRVGAFLVAVVAAAVAAPIVGPDLVPDQTPHHMTHYGQLIMGGGMRAFFALTWFMGLPMVGLTYAALLPGLFGRAPLGGNPERIARVAVLTLAALAAANLGYLTYHWWYPLAAGRAELNGPIDALVTFGYPLLAVPILAAAIFLLQHRQQEANRLLWFAFLGHLLMYVGMADPSIVPDDIWTPGEPEHGHAEVLAMVRWG